MTVSSTTNKATYSGNGTTTAFTVPFYFLAAADLQVILRSSAGVETVQTLTSQYTVTGAGVASGGTVTMVAAPASGTTLTVLRNVSPTQETDLLPNDRLPAESLETALDKATMLIQQLDEEVGRSLKYPATDTAVSAQLPTATARAGKYLGFDATGLPVVADGPATPYSAADVTFTASGAGAVPRSVSARLRDSINAKDFGALGDGAANDTTALQAALTAAAGKSLYLPAGSYSINAALSVPAGTVVFAEPGSATVTQSTAATNAFTVDGDGVTIEGLKIVGPNSGAGSAVRADSRNNVAVLNCQVQNWLYGIQLRGCKNWEVSGNRIWGGTYDGSSSADIFIYGSSGAPSSRGVVSGNLCLSNNDQGISADTNSGDKDLLVSGNVVFPLQSDGLTALADGNNRRRYGIVFGYNGTSATRAVVSGNVVRDVPYSGIYMNVATLPSGDVSITGNVVSRCGFGTLYPSDASLRAGIFCNGGADSITGNVVVDCTTSGIKVAPGFTYSSASQPRAAISSNTVARTTGPGIWLTIKPHGYLVSSNRIINSTGAAIQYETTTSDGGNCHFVGNLIDTNTADQGGIVASNAAGGYECSIVGNRINGTDNTTSNQFNAGVWFDGVVHVMGNSVNKFYWGINCGTSFAARTINVKCSGNSISNAARGISSSGAGPWLVTDNTFNSVSGNECNGAAWQGLLYRASGTNGFNGGAIYVADTSAPTAGTWAVGDHCAKTNVASGQPKGWFCTVAGTPGTWTSEGNL
jgi:hypothetical protein